MIGMQERGMFRHLYGHRHEVNKKTVFLQFVVSHKVRCFAHLLAVPFLHYVIPKSPYI